MATKQQSQDPLSFVLQSVSGGAPMGPLWKPRMELMSLAVVALSKVLR